MNFLHLLLYEGIKLFQRKWLITLLILALIANVAYFNNGKKYDFFGYTDMDIYKEHLHPYVGALTEEKHQDLEKQISLYEELIWYESTSRQLQLRENNAMLFADELDEERFLAVAKLYENYKPFTGSIGGDLNIYNHIFEDYTYAYNYKEYLDTVQTQAENMRTISIFSNPGGFSRRNIEKTARAFMKNYNLVLSFDINDGIMAIVNYHVTDWLLIIIVLLLSSLIFGREKSLKIDPLLRHTKGGKRKLIHVKIIAFIILTLIITALFYVSILIAANRVYGFGDILRPLQSLPKFRSSVYHINIRTFFEVSILLKEITLIILGLVLGLLLYKTKNQIVAITITILIFVASYLAYGLIQYNSALNVFKHVNIITFLNAFDTIGMYQNMNLFTFAINQDIALLVIPLLVIYLYILTCYAYNSQGKWRFALAEKIMDKIRRFFSWRFWVHGIFAQDCYRILVQRMGALILILAAVISYQFHDDTNIRSLSTEEYQVYAEYIETFPQYIGDELKDSIEEEKALFSKYRTELMQLSKKLENGNITYDEYNQKSIKYNLFLEREKGFERYLMQYVDLGQIAEQSGENLYMINMQRVVRIFDLDEFYYDEVVNAAFIIALMVFLISSIYAYDREKRVYSFFRSTKVGYRKLSHTRFLTTMFLAFLSFVAVYVPYMMVVVPHYNLTEYFAYSLKSIPAFSQFPFAITIGQYILFMNVGRLLCAFFTAMIIQAISLHMKQQISAVIISLLLILPIAINATFPSTIPYFLQDSFAFNLIFNGYSIHMGGLIVLMILGVGCQVICYKRYRMIIN